MFNFYFHCTHSTTEPNTEQYRYLQWRFRICILFFIGNELTKPLLFFSHRKHVQNEIFSRLNLLFRQHNSYSEFVQFYYTLVAVAVLQQLIRKKVETN